MEMSIHYVTRITQDKSTKLDTGSYTTRIKVTCTEWGEPHNTTQVHEMTLFSKTPLEVINV